MAPATAAGVRLRALPTLSAAALSLAYLIASPRSLDLAAQLFRTRLFGAEGFGAWNNWWYAGHNVTAYSVLFPPLAHLLTPQAVAAAAAVIAATAFGELAHRHFGPDAWLGSAWFAVGITSELLSGRLTFVSGLAAALATALALQRRRSGPAAAAAVAAALISPVAALFAALAGAADALGGQSRRTLATGLLTVAAALTPLAVLGLLFPEHGHEPFVFSALWPIPVIAAALLAAAPRTERTLRAGIVLYTAGCLADYAIPTPVGGNAVRLGQLLAGPLAALLLWPRRRAIGHPALLLAAAAPLLYLQWQAGVRDVIHAESDPSTTAAYYRPLLTFLARQPGPPFRIEIPLTRDHWEADEVAGDRGRVALARGWERQVDIADNALFYRPGLTSRAYGAWLHRLAVRFVALPDVPLDSSARAEAALIRSGRPYLRLVDTTRHWRIYAVADPTPIVTGAARLIGLGPNWLELDALRAGRALVRVRYSPYWQLSAGSARPEHSGPFTVVAVRRPGRVRLAIDPPL